MGLVVVGGDQRGIADESVRVGGVETQGGLEVPCRCLCPAWSGRRKEDVSGVTSLRA